MGPLILDLKSFELDAEERDMLQHPLVAGVILFSRNYQSPAQISELCRAIRSSRAQPMLIAVDHEGGRVQRFREGFTVIPPMRQIGNYYKENPNGALKIAEACGWLMAAELLSVGVNLSFAPVLDLDKNNQSVIGDRAFAADDEIVIKLSTALISGMHQVGMAATGKHFPGHGSVTLDSHKTMPVDERTLKEVQSDDMQPFIKLMQEKVLDAVMPAHILFPQMDDKPVGFSSYWLKTILRQQLGFDGIIISDDLSMEGAAFAGNHLDRAKLALNAGCDVILACNNRVGAIQILDGLSPNQYHLTNEKVRILLGKSSSVPEYGSLLKSKIWEERVKLLKQVETCKL